MEIKDFFAENVDVEKVFLHVLYLLFLKLWMRFKKTSDCQDK